MRGVFELPLGPCVLDVFTGENTLVVACPGRDMLRVWPLPVGQPWWEDSAESAGAGRCIE